MYSALYWDHVRNPRNNQPLPKAQSGESRYVRCGDRLTLYLEIKDDKIVQARFQARACGPVVAVASLATDMLKNMSIHRAQKIDIFQIDQQLGGLPPSKRHAYLLFLESLHQALLPHDSKQRN